MTSVAIILSTEKNMQTQAEVKFEAKVEAKKSSEAIKAEIFLLYKNALTNAKTSHIDLQAALLRQLDNFEQFKTVVNQLVKIPHPKAIKIDGKEYPIDTFWSPKLFFDGSKLRTVLSEAIDKEKILQVEYSAACKREQKLQSEIITQKLQADNLTWDDCEKLRDQINDWFDTLKFDLEDFINYKQAELIFKKHILSHQSNYKGAIFAMKSVLFTLSINNNIADILNNIIDFDEQSDFFLTVDKQVFRENVCAAFIVICKEWFRLGAAFSFNDKKQDPKTLLYYFPDAEEVFTQLNCPTTEDYKFNNVFKVSLESYSNSKETLSFCEKHLPPTIVIMNEINAYQKNSLHTARQDLFIHRIYQYLRWIADLPCREDMAFIDKVKINEFIKAQSEAAEASKAFQAPQELPTQTLYTPPSP